MSNYITEVLKNPTPYYFDYYNMSSLITGIYFSDYKIKRDVMNQFLEEYLIKSKGCIDPKAINYNNIATIGDDSCLYKTYGGFF